jgi:hypothetical protein
VVASNDPEFAPLLKKVPAGKYIVDLVGIWNTDANAGTAPMEAYDGIAW